MTVGYPDYQMGYIRDRQTIAILDGIWHDVRMEYNTSGLMEYRAVHEFHKAATTDPAWEVWKYTYDTSGRCTRIEGPLRGTWDTRASLGWA